MVSLIRNNKLTTNWLDKEGKKIRFVTIDSDKSLLTGKKTLVAIVVVNNLTMRRIPLIDFLENHTPNILI